MSNEKKDHFPVEEVMCDHLGRPLVGRYAEAERRKRAAGRSYVDIGTKETWDGREETARDPFPQR